MRNSSLELSGSSEGVEMSLDSGHVLKGEGQEFVYNLNMECKQEIKDYWKILGLSKLRCNNSFRSGRLWREVTGNRTQIGKQDVDTSLRSLLHNQVSNWMYKSGTQSTLLPDRPMFCTQVTPGGLAPHDGSVSAGNQEADWHFCDEFSLPVVTLNPAPYLDL